MRSTPTGRAWEELGRQSDSTSRAPPRARRRARPAACPAPDVPGRRSASTRPRPSPYPGGPRRPHSSSDRIQTSDIHERPEEGKRPRRRCELDPGRNPGDQIPGRRRSMLAPTGHEIMHLGHQLRCAAAAWTVARATARFASRAKLPLPAHRAHDVRVAPPSPVPPRTTRSPSSPAGPPHRTTAWRLTIEAAYISSSRGAASIARSAAGPRYPTVGYSAVGGTSAGSEPRPSAHLWRAGTGVDDSHSP